MFVSALWPAVVGALAAVSYAKPTKTTRSAPLSRRAPEGPQFVTTENGKFVVNGAPLKFVGTNAYWLSALDKEEDIDKTLADIAAAGIKVVRTWGFNDVVDIPETGTWFQQIKDGKVVAVNDGPNGLQKLDKVIELAEKHDIYVLVSLTNNWNPHPNDPGSALARRNNDGSSGSNKTRQRNELSNDYGGMDTYVREFGLKDHDEFYRNTNIVEAFKNYTEKVVRRYASKPSLFGWELANDPRCNSTLPTSGCNPKVVTKWHADIADHVRTIDKNHLISSGNGGYFCLDCPKLFPLPAQAPPPAASPAPGSRRRSAQPLTKRQLLRDRLETRKKRRSAKPQTGGSGLRIRGRWAPQITRRQEDLQATGPAYDGSYGVDSQDIVGIPDVDFGSFQYFPDQNRYAPDDPSLTPYENVVENGNEWIRSHAGTSDQYGKPVTMNAFGLVTQDNLPSFAPFDNSNSAPFGSDGGVAQTPLGVTNEERDRAYETWINTGLEARLTNVLQWQWGQPELSVAPGTPVGVATDGTGVATNIGSTGVSPNDGYSINDQGRQGVIEVIQNGNQAFANDAVISRRR